MGAVADRAKITTVAAYLDLAEPDLSAAARQLAEAGHTMAVVVPLLFTEAFHATVDVPETVRDVSGSLPLELVVADILGTGDEVADLLRQSMVAARIDEQSSCCSVSGRPVRPRMKLLLILRLGSRMAVAVRYAPVSAPARQASPTCWTGCPSLWRSSRFSSLRVCCSYPYASWRPSTAG